MRLGSLFDGSGGFPLAGVLCGMIPVWASEIEKFPIAVTSKRFPNMKHLGDIRGINGAAINPVDIITFGSPCQDLSVAGKRAGLKGERSGLFMEAIRIVKEMRCATNEKYPRYILWENVPGAFSSNKREDFRAVLESVAKIADPKVSVPRSEKKWNGAGEIVADSFSIAYRTFDAQFWGVPQRRRRIFLVADLTGQCAGKILFERAGLFGDSAPGGKTWETIAAALGDRTLFSSLTLKIRGGKSGGGKGPLIQYEKSAALSCNNDQTLFTAGFHWYKSAKAEISYSDEQVPVLEANMPNAVLSAGFSAGNSAKAGSIGYRNEQTPTLRGAASGSNQVPVICYRQKDYTEFVGSNIGATLMAHGGSYGGGSRNLIIELNIHNCRDKNIDHFRANRKTVYPDVTGTLCASCAGLNRPAGQGNEADMCVCIAGNTIGRKAQNGSNGTGYKENVCYTLNTADRHAICIDARNFRLQNKVSGTLQAKGNGGYSLNYVNPVMCNYAVRRLTPLECCRLQGFPDWWCDDVPGSDSAKYKLWGNGIALPCALYIMQGIAEIERKHRRNKE